MAALEDALLAALRSNSDRAAAAEALRKALLRANPSTDGTAAAVAGSLERGTTLELVDALLIATRTANGRANEASKLCALRTAAYKGALALLGQQEDGVSERQATDLVSALRVELRIAPSAPEVAEISEAALKAFQSDAPMATCALDLLPEALTILQTLGAQAEAASPGGGSDSASDPSSGLVQQVLQHPWPPEATGRVVAALRAFPLTKQQLLEAVAAAVRRAKAAKPEDLPAIVCQLLLLAARGCRDTIWQGPINMPLLLRVGMQEVVGLMEHKESLVPAGPGGAAQRRLLLQVEGSMLLQIDMDVKHDAELGHAWLRCLRAPGGAAALAALLAGGGDGAPGALGTLQSPFAVGLSFMLAGVQRFEQAATDALRALTVNYYKDAAQRASLAWLPAPAAGASARRQQEQEADGGEGGGDEDGGDPLRTSLLRFVCNSRHGQGALVQAMAGVAVALVEAGAAKGAAAWYREDGSLDTELAPPAAKAGDLGMHMLLELFAAHKECRRDVIRLCHSRLVGAKEEAAAPFVRTLAMLVRRNGAEVAEHINELKTSLDQLVFLPPQAATGLLLAVWPLCRCRRDIRDYVVMLLRKAMFSRELQTRLLAARGFLYMVHQEAQAGEEAAAAELAASLPSTSLSQRPAVGSAGGATLLHELLGFLRRCLGQQPEVRRVLYQALPAVLAADPSIQESVVEPLLPHFHKFYPERAPPPLKLEAAAHMQGETPHLMEPLQHLVAGLRRALLLTAPCAAATDITNLPPTEARVGSSLAALLAEAGEGEGEEGEGSAVASLCHSLVDLRERLVKAVVEEWNWDDSTDFSLGSKQGQVNLAQVDMVLGCMEVSMEDLVEEILEAAGEGASTESQARQLLELYSQHQRLVSLATASRAKKGEGDATTQAAGAAGGGAKRGRPAAGGAAAPAPAAVAIDKRTPVLSYRCLAALLDAVCNDGLVDSAAAGAGPTSGSQSLHSQLVRQAHFQLFVFSAALRALQAAQAGELIGAIAAGTAGAPAAEAAGVVRLLAPAQQGWQQLGAPLFRAAHMAVLANTNSRVVVTKGTKKEKDEFEPVTQMALRALDQLLGMGHGAAGVAALLAAAPPAPRDAAEEAGLPSSAGLSQEQQVIAGRLPYLHQLLDAMVDKAPAWQRELESLGPTLAALAALLPPAHAARVAEWGEEACQSAKGLTLGGAAKGLMTLAVGCRAVARGDDLALLQAFAVEVKDVYNQEDGEVDESDRFPVLAPRTMRACVTAIAMHVDASLSALDWAVAKLKAAPAALPEGGTWGMSGSERLRAGAARRKWEEAVCGRLAGVVGVLVPLMEARIASHATLEQLLRTATHAYKLLAMVARSQFVPKGFKQQPPSRAFQSMVADANRRLKEVALNCVSELQQTENDGGAANAGAEAEAEGGKGKGKGKGKEKKKKVGWEKDIARAKREARIVPNLIFQIEDYEKHLIRLSKLCGVNLMGTAKRSTNRDFRLQLGGQGSEGDVAREHKRRRREEEEQRQQQEEGQEEDEEEDEQGDREMEDAGDGQQEGEEEEEEEEEEETRDEETLEGEED